MTARKLCGQTMLGIVGTVLMTATMCGPPQGSAPAGAEPNAIHAAVNGSIALAQAVYMAQNGAIPIGDNQQVISGDLVFGTCPVVSTTISLEEQITADMTIDFGEGCSPYDVDWFICSGSATGTFRQADRKIELSFDALGCGEQTINGASSVVYNLTNTIVAVAGSWDLDYVFNDTSYGTAGAGSGQYDRDARQATITTFGGTVSDASGSWAVQVDEVVISLANNATLLPSSGEVTLSGDDIRTIIVRFDENTPVTGEIQVSLDGNDFVTVDLLTMSVVLEGATGGGDG
jgi:hypothetical protein